MPDLHGGGMTETSTRWGGQKDSSSSDKLDWIKALVKSHFRIIFRMSIISTALVQLWINHSVLNSGDPVSYLDMADGIYSGKLRAFANSYWSPLYPSILGAPLHFFRVKGYWEPAVVHAVNLFIFLLAFWSFETFWGLFIKNTRSLVDTESGIPESSLWCFGYIAFGSGSLLLSTPNYVSPDMLLTVFIYWSAILTIRIRNRVGTYWDALLLGIVVGLGYLEKAPFLPIGILIIACAAFTNKSNRTKLVIAALAFSTLAVIAVPYISLISKVNEHFTFGDSGRLNYAWFIDDVPGYTHWQGKPPGNGEPEHPTRKLLAFPEVYEFATPITGTYPPWDDPAYWHAGLKPKLHPTKELILAIHYWVQVAQYLIWYQSGLTYAVLIFALSSFSPSIPAMAFMRFWYLWIPSVTATVMYSLVHLEGRFLDAYFVLIWAAALCAFRFDTVNPRIIRATTASAVLITSVLLLWVTFSTSHTQNGEGTDIGLALSALGLKPGDQIAAIGPADYDWARLARLSVIAEIPAGTPHHPKHAAMDFWTADYPTQQRAIEILRGTGAKVIVATYVPFTVAPPGWQQVGETNAFIYALQSNLGKGR